MSHTHNIDGLSNTAAQYQAYLERLRATHLAEEDDKVRKKARDAKFLIHFDPEEDAKQGTEQNETDAREESPEEEADTGTGFGSHYA
jgi:hypothetical protein